MAVFSRTLYRPYTCCTDKMNGQQKSTTERDVANCNAALLRILHTEYPNNFQCVHKNNNKKKTTPEVAVASEQVELPQMCTVYGKLHFKEVTLIALQTLYVGYLSSKFSNPAYFMTYTLTSGQFEIAELQKQ